MKRQKTRSSACHAPKSDKKNTGCVRLAFIAILQLEASRKCSYMVLRTVIRVVGGCKVVAVGVVVAGDSHSADQPINCPAPVNER